MRYIGSKSNLLSHIEGVVDNLGVKEGIFCDLFAGTACVAAHFKRRGFQIISNDLLELSYAFQQALIVNNEEPEFAVLLSRHSAICQTIAHPLIYPPTIR